MSAGEVSGVKRARDGGSSGSGGLADIPELSSGGLSDWENRFLSLLDNEGGCAESVNGDTFVQLLTGGLGVRVGKKERGGKDAERVRRGD